MVQIGVTRKHAKRTRYEEISYSKDQDKSNACIPGFTFSTALFRPWN